MRNLNWLTTCRVFIALSVVLMLSGTLMEDGSWLRAWAILAGILSAGLCIRGAVKEAAVTIQAGVEAYVKRWAHKTFEDGFKSGIDVGREMEATERFIASTTRRDSN